MAKHVLLCPPTYFDVVDQKNPHMSGKGGVDREKAQRQWQALRSALEQCGCQVETIAPVPELEDMVFAANQVFVGFHKSIGKFILPSRMVHASRQREVPFYVDWYRQRGYKIVEVSLGDDRLEGHGDLLWHPDWSRVYAGYGFRSTHGGVEKFRDAMTELGIPVVLLNEASGNQVWTWQPSQGSVEIISATAGGGVAVKNIVGNQEDVVRLDSNGNATYDTWGTAGGSAGYGVLSNSTYFANGLWVGTTGDPVIAGVIGDTESDAPDVYPNHGGTPQNQGSADPNLMLVAMTDNWGFVNGAQQARQIQYILVYPNGSPLTQTNGNWNPLSNSPLYNVYELQSNPEVATGHTPCGTSDNPCDGFSDEITPYGFNDNHWCGIVASKCPPQTSIQTFTYGLSGAGQRQYAVHTILRRIGSQTYCQLLHPEILFYKANASQPLLLGLPPFYEQYIYQQSPYLGVASSGTVNPPPCAAWETSKSLGF